MAKRIDCEDGFVITGDTDDELVENAFAHLKEHHPDLYATATREQVLGWAVAA